MRELVATGLLTILLLQYAKTISHLAGIAADPATTITDLRAWGASPAVHAGLALVALLIPSRCRCSSPEDPEGVEPATRLCQ